MKTKKKQILVYLALIAVAFIIGFSFIFVKIALKYATSLDVLAYRFASATALLILLDAFKIIKLPKLNFRKIWPVLLLSLFYPILFFGLQTIGLVYSTASEAGIIFALTPVITLIFAALFLKEKTTLIQKIGVLVSMFGVIYIFYNKGIAEAGGSLLGNSLLMLSVISIVGYYVLGKKLTQTYTAMDLTIIIVFVAFIAFTSMALVSHAYDSSWSQLITPLTSRLFIVSILYLGILSTLFTSLLTNYALSVIPASTVSIFNNLSPVIAVIGGVVVLGDQLYNFHILGGLLVFAGVFATVFFKKKQDMINKNIENLTGLWKLALGSGLQTSDRGKISFGWIANCKWPNRIWINGKPNAKMLDKVYSIMKSTSHELTFSYFDFQDSNEHSSMTKHMFQEISVQYGMHLELNSKHEFETDLTFKEVKTKQDAQVWSEVFDQSFHYSINSETVYKTAQHVKYFTVQINNKEIGTVALYFYAGVAGVHSLSVVPEESCKGYAREITLFVLNQSYDAKVKVVTLQATEQTKKMYLDLGFSTEFLMRNYQLK